MRNNFINKLENSVKITAEGKNINNFIKKLINNKIEIIKLNYISYNKVEIIIKYKDYIKLVNMRSIYKINLVEKYGKIKIKDKINENKILFFSLLIGISLIFFLSNIIFKVEIIHTNKEIISLLENELKYYGIEKYKFKKNYKELKEITDKILNNNKTKLEWLEIETVGTKYIVRIEERKIQEEIKNNQYQDIVMSKSGTIKIIIAISGEKTKEINTFASEGDIIISGKITKPNGEIIYTNANGKIYAEVWYSAEVEYPYHYKEEILTGNTKKVYYINFLNKRISLFNFKKFNSFQKEPNIIMQSSILPISFIKEKQYEVKVIDEIYTEEQVIDKAVILAEDKLLSSNSKIISIDEVNILYKENQGSKIKIKLFLSVTEEVSMIKEIINEENSNQNN